MELIVLFEGYNLIKSLQMNTIPLKLTQNLQSTLPPRKHAIRWISNYSPAKIFNNNSYNLYECFDNHPIKITSGFGLWHHWTVWVPSFQTSPSAVCDCISLYNSLLINLRLLYGYAWKFISPEDRPKGVASNLSVYRVSDYHISSIKCFCDRGNFYTV